MGQLLPLGALLFVAGLIAFWSIRLGKRVSVLKSEVAAFLVAVLLTSVMGLGAGLMMVQLL